MKLSDNTIKGLAKIQNENILTEGLFSKILDSVIFHISRNNEPEGILTFEDFKCPIVKSAFADISCLYVEAARHNLDADSFETFMRSEQISGLRINLLRDHYANNKHVIQTQLESTGNSLNHIIDVDWRLDYCLQSTVENSIGKPLYHIRFSTLKYGAIKYIKFTCTIQQLQELVYKLKDAGRHIEKLSNN